MEQRLGVVTLGVRDLARARAFYDAIGWRAKSDDGGTRRRPVPVGRRSA